MSAEPAVQPQARVAGVDPAFGAAPARPRGGAVPPPDPDFDIRPWLDIMAAAFGGGANVVMQLAWPEVGYGVQESRVDSGKVFVHPWKRARTTATYLSVAILGTDRDREIYRKAIDTVHRHVYSTESSPVRYHAFSVELQKWVGACLVMGPWDYYCKVFGRPDDWTAEQFYRHASRLATSLQVPESVWPPTFEEFWQYWEEGKQRIHIDERTRLYLEDVLSARFLPWPLTFGGPFLRWVNIGFLHPEFRDAMQIEWTERDERRLRRLLRVVRLVRAVTPGVIWRLGVHLNIWDLRTRHRWGIRIL
jgi:uncharacterized protein (DUF2236 family)